MISHSEKQLQYRYFNKIRYTKKKNKWKKIQNLKAVIFRLNSQ